MASFFSITENIIPCQHIRVYPKSANNDHAPLRLAIKEYRPLDNLNAEEGSVTIIATHGLGFPKVPDRIVIRTAILVLTSVGVL